jgi:tetraacyldisaccharide 4'-kinase
MKLLRIILSPLSLLYAAVVLLRNRLFDNGVLTSKLGSIPTVVVGNVTVGGTGKTPFTVLLLKLLANKKVGFLSRGYGRKSNGFVVITPNSDTSLVGDEPALICMRTAPLLAAVCEDRLEGIESMKKLEPKLELVVLDDAMQHRSLVPNFLVMLSSYNRPFYSDFMLPSGWLRDNRKEARRAHAIVVTKCPESISTQEQISISKEISHYSKAPVFFSYIEYEKPKHVMNDSLELSKGADVLVVTSIAQPDVFIAEVAKAHSVKKVKEFRDHHDFTIADVRLLLQEFESIVSANKAILMTEKDAVKLKKYNEFSTLPVFYIPIEFRFIGQQERFEDILRQRLEFN